MDQVIVYKNDEGVISLITPTAEAFEKSSILQIAVKAVAQGKPFKILGRSDLPDAPQEMWEVDDADLTDGVGA